MDADEATEHLIKLVENQDTEKLCKILFDIEITPGQKEIIDSVVWDDDQRICITAFTRYGKTYAVAAATALYLFLNKGKTVNEIAPVQRQAKKFRQYLVEFILKCDLLREQLDVNAKGAEKIKKEVSKQRMTFKDGNEVNILTAGGSNIAQSLMGEGGDLIIEDEACDIPDEVFTKRISRMLGDNPDSILIEIGNPWRKDSHFYDHFNDDRYRQIQIDCEQGKEEGQITQDFIDDQRKELTEMEFKVLYKAEFPDSIENGLIKHSWVEAAKEREPFDFEADEKIEGIDVAELGQDKTVVATTYQENNQVNVDSMDSWGNTETMETVAKVDGLLHGYEYLVVDAIGVGSGVASRLREKGYDTYAAKVSESPSSQKSRYSNKKAQWYWKLRQLFEDGRISLDPDIDSELTSQLTKVKYEHTNSGKIKIIDPDDGSPDFADALMLACSKSNAGQGSGTAGVHI